jgi:hypothetical protein
MVKVNLIILAALILMSLATMVQRGSRPTDV